MGASIGLIAIAVGFIVFNLVLLVRRQLRTRYAVVSIFAASVWPAMMMILSVEAFDVARSLVRPFSGRGLVAWILLLLTAGMVLIPSLSLCRRLLTRVDRDDSKEKL